MLSETPKNDKRSIKSWEKIKKRKFASKKRRNPIIVIYLSDLKTDWGAEIIGSPVPLSIDNQPLFKKSSLYIIYLLLKDN